SHLTLSGHVWENDYRLAVTAEKSQLGFINAGWEQYRKYYDDTGGYRPSPSTPRAISLGEDLNLDIGKAWFDIGLTLPNWPRMVLGYEYDYRRGDEAITSWQGYGSGFDERNIAPASKHLREGVHIIKFDFDYEVGGFAIEDRFRGEFY